MRCVRALLVLLVSFAHLGCAVPESDHWSRIKELSKKPHEDNPELLKYLKSLSKAQTLTALRQAGKEAEAELPAERWPETGLSVAILMRFYPEPLQRSDLPLSDEELRNMRPNRKLEFEAGLWPGRLSDDAFDKLLAGIADRNEGAFFRYALAGYAVFKPRLGPLLTISQKGRLATTYLDVLRDQESPEVVRRECYESATRLLGDERRRIIYGDEAVKKVMRTESSEQRRDLDARIASGAIKLAVEASEALAACERRIRDFEDSLLALRDDERESESLRAWATKKTSPPHSPPPNTAPENDKTRSTK